MWSAQALSLHVPDRKPRQPQASREENVLASCRPRAYACSPPGRTCLAGALPWVFDSGQLDLVTSRSVFILQRAGLVCHKKIAPPCATFTPLLFPVGNAPVAHSI